MAVVVVDNGGRLTIPRQFELRDTKATLIPAGPFLILVPVPRQPLDASASWLDSTRSRKELKGMAEKVARKDVMIRAKRRKPI
jgi:virulence-associated protein VagC